MALTSFALYAIAAILIAHSGYSAYEASYNAKLMATQISVPIDVSMTEMEWGVDREHRGDLRDTNDTSDEIHDIDDTYHLNPTTNTD